MQKNTQDKSRIYRYRLHRICDKKGKDCVNFIMLNPSTADENNDDATIRSCIRIAKSKGFREMYVTNLFAYRATNPKKLKDAKIDIIGPENNKFIKKYAKKCKCLILARGGKYGKIGDRDREVLKKLSGYKKYCLGKTKSGQPKHPLYIPSNSKLIEFKGE